VKLPPAPDCHAIIRSLVATGIAEGGLRDENGQIQALVELSLGADGTHPNRIKKIVALCNTVSSHWWREKKPIAGLCVWGISDDHKVIGLNAQQTHRLRTQLTKTMNKKLLLGTESTHAFVHLTCNELSGCAAMDPELSLLVLAVKVLDVPNAVVTGNQFEYYEYQGTSAVSTSRESLVPFFPAVSDASATRASMDRIMNSQEQRRLVLLFRDDAHTAGLLSSTAPPVQVLREADLWETVAATVLFGDNFTAEVTFWAQDNAPLKTKTFHGLYHLLGDELFDLASAFCANAHDIKWEGFGRHVWDPFPKSAFREVMANAVLHGRYDAFAVQSDLPAVRVDVYKSHIVVTNQCHPSAQQLASFFDTPPQRNMGHNTRLQRALQLVTRIEAKGTGLPRIFTESVSWGKQPPEIEYRSGIVVGDLLRSPTWSLRLYDGPGSPAVRAFATKLVNEHGIDDHSERFRLLLTLLAWQGKDISELRRMLRSKSLQKGVKMALKDPVCPVRVNDGILCLKPYYADLVLQQ
jgi:predicted HTH transcriptional regulator